MSDTLTIAGLADARIQRCFDGMTLADYVRVLRIEIHGLNQIARSDSPEAERAREKVAVLRDAIRYYEAKLIPVAHVTWWWQRPLGRLGIKTTSLCGERIVAGDAAGPTQQCRECQRALDGAR
jgi:hypothetical protein